MNSQFVRARGLGLLSTLKTRGHVLCILEIIKCSLETSTDMNKEVLTRLFIAMLHPTH